MENKRKTKRQSVDSKNVEELIKRHEFLIQSARDIILFIQHNDGRIIEANAAAVKTYQYSLEELQTMTIYDLRAPETRSQVIPQMETASSQGILFETVHIKKNGENFPVEVSSQGTVMDDRLILLSIIRDISERKKAEQQLQENESNLRALLNAVTESFFLMDKDGTVLAANETFAKRLGVNMDKLIGAIIYDLLSPDLAKLRKKQTENVISTGKPVRFEDIRSNRNIDQVIYPILDTKGQVVRMAVFGVDITQRREIEKQLETMALTDQLTGLYNRRGFITLVERQLQQAKRSRRKMLLFFADIDGMKWINDKFGHKEGDKALVSAAKILVQTFRTSDIISRIGGDEFAMLAVDIDNKALDSLQNRFNKFLDYLNCRKRQKYCLSISIGFAAYDPYNPSSLDELMFNADISMYENKKLKKISNI